MPKLKAIAAQIIAEEFQAGIENGLIPNDSDPQEINFLYEFNVDLLYQLIRNDSQLKAILKESYNRNRRVTLEQLFTVCV